MARTPRPPTDLPGSVLDAEVSTICAELEARHKEWRRLWEATPYRGKRTPADDAFDAYGADVWPNCPDLVDRLIALPAVTVAGVRAKAAAALAIRENGHHEGPFNEDALTDAALRDAAALV